MSDSRREAQGPPNPALFTASKPVLNNDSKDSDEKGGLIEEVLQQTSHALISRQPLSDADKRALEDVAARMRGRPLEAVVAELVLVTLKQHMSGLPGFNDLGPALAQRVARTLIDDPAAKPRLEALWTRLQGGAS